MEEMVVGPLCHLCGEPLRETFADLGMSPLSNCYLAVDQLGSMEAFYPLHAYVCTTCLLVQVPAIEAPQRLFSDYAYFSSFSDSWLGHARRFCVESAKRFGLGPGSLVLEVASNDGYLLQYFREAGVPVLGIEPAANVARAAQDKGIPTLVRFMGRSLGEELAADKKKADLVVANNVLAHVPDLDDFTAGLASVLKPQGTLSLEFPHLLRLIRERQFDTIYHEHFSYLSLEVATRVLARHGLVVFDVEELATHGGSLRVYAGHAATAASRATSNPARIIEDEIQSGLRRLETYRSFSDQVQAVKRDLLRFLIDAREQGKQVAGYGAPAKGNTLLNYCGVRTDLLAYTVDRNPHKQGRFLPGTRIPIHAPGRIAETRPDYVLILPWNLREEIVGQMAGIRKWGGKFVVPIPRVEVMA